jgi:hypothetical protein
MLLPSRLGFGRLQRRRWLRHRGICILRRGEARQRKVAAWRGRPKRSKGRSTEHGGACRGWRLASAEDWTGIPRNKVDSETVILPVDPPRNAVSVLDPNPCAACSGPAAPWWSAKRRAAGAGCLSFFTKREIRLSPRTSMVSIYFHQIRGRPKSWIEPKKHRDAIGTFAEKYRPFFMLATSLAIRPLSKLDSGQSSAEIP